MTNSSSPVLSLFQTLNTDSTLSKPKPEETMKRTSKSFLGLYLSHKFLTQTNPPSPIKHLSVLRSLSTMAKNTGTTISAKSDQFHTKSKKDSLILEKFRQRKHQGSSKTNTQLQETTNSSAAEVALRSDCSVEGGEVGSGPAKVVSCFEELGLKEEVTMAAGEMGVWVPSEIQCVGIPAILEGKSVVLSSDYGSGRTLAYLLPLVQLLRQDEALSSMKPKHPKAVVLCSTEELSDEGFRVAKLIINFARLNSARESGSDHLVPGNVSNGPIGMLIGTPGEVVHQMEEGSIITDNVKYLVLDDADVMLENGLAPKISKISSPLKNRISEPHNQQIQTVLVTSTLRKMLGNTDTMDCLEHDNAGKVTAMLLEMDQTEVLESIKSSATLKRKIAEAIDSLTIAS